MSLPRLSSVFFSFVLAASLGATGCAAEASDEAVQDSAAVQDGQLEITKVAVAGPDDAADQYLLRVTVGTISAERFEELHARFGTKAGEHDAAKSYTLDEFLPSFARAVNGKALDPYSAPADASLIAAMQTKEMANDGQAYVNANCHSVTWQWVNQAQGRGSDDAVVTLADGDALLERTAQFQEVAKDALRAGDIYLVEGTGGMTQSGSILHSGVFLGDGLVFEKANPGKEYPYRLAYLDDVMAKYKRVDSDSKFHFRRVAASPKIPTLSEELSMLNRKDELGFTTVSDDVLGQHILQEEFNFELDRSDFTIGKLVPSAKVPASKLFSVAR